MKTKRQSFGSESDRTWVFAWIRIRISLKRNWVKKGIFNSWSRTIQDINTFFCQFLSNYTWIFLVEVWIWTKFVADRIQPHIHLNTYVIYEYIYVCRVLFNSLGPPATFYLKRSTEGVDRVKIIFQILLKHIHTVWIKQIFIPFIPLIDRNLSWSIWSVTSKVFFPAWRTSFESILAIARGKHSTGSLCMMYHLMIWYL